MKRAEELKDAGDNLKRENDGGGGDGIESAIEDALGSKAG